MRILIYIEPFPLRQTMDHYRKYAAAFARMLLSETTAHRLSEFDIRIYANRDTLAYAQERALAAKRFMLNPESAEQDQFRTSLTEWPNQGLRTWTNLLKGVGEVTQQYQQIFERIHQRFAFDAVVTLGDNGAAKAFAASANLDHLVLDTSFENQSLFKAVVFDPTGTGGFSALSQINVSTVKSMVGKEAWTAPLDQSCLPGLDADQFRAECIGPIDFTGQDRILRRGDTRAALVCLQNYDDPLFAAHSKFASPLEMIEACLPELCDNNILSVIRPPRGGVSSLGQSEAIAEVRKRVERYGDKAIWLDRQSERVSDTRLFTLCDLIVTTNDAAGLEGVLFDKQVCVLGSASYKPIGAFPQLKAVVSGRFDPRSYLKNIAALRAYMLRSRLVDPTSTLTFDTFADRLVQTLEAWHDSGTNAKRALEDIYTRYAPTQTERMKFELDKRRDQEEVEHPALPEPSRDQISLTKKLWNRSVTGITSRARRSIGEKLLHSSSPARGSLSANPLFASDREHEPAQSMPMPDHPLDADEERIIETARQALQTANEEHSTFAVIAHCFYLDTTKQLMARLRTIDQTFDLYVSVPTFGGREIQKTIQADFPNATIVTLPNRGRDVWPFCFILSALNPDRYDSVLKLHAPKPHFETQNTDRHVGETWVDYSLSCLFDPRDNRARIDEILSLQDQWSMAGPEGLVSSTKQKHLTLGFDAVAALQGLEENQVPQHWSYIQGGMYWIDPGVLRPILAAFTNPAHYINGAIAHPCPMHTLAEYAFALAAQQSQKSLCSLSPVNTPPILNPAPDPEGITPAIDAFLLNDP